MKYIIIAIHPNDNRVEHLQEYPVQENEPEWVQESALRVAKHRARGYDTDTLWRWTIQLLQVEQEDNRDTFKVIDPWK